MDKGYGQTAYEAYAAHQGGKNYQGAPIPAWSAVRADIKAAWEVAACAVLNRHHQEVNHDDPPPLLRPLTRRLAAAWHGWRGTRSTP